MLAIEGLPIPKSMQGRVLIEAMQKPGKVTTPAVKTERLEVSRGKYCAVIEVSSIGAHRYLNYGSRCADVGKSGASGRRVPRQRQAVSARTAFDRTSRMVAGPLELSVLCGR